MKVAVVWRLCKWERRSSSHLCHAHITNGDPLVGRLSDRDTFHAVVTLVSPSLCPFYRNNKFLQEQLQWKEKKTQWRQRVTWLWNVDRQSESELGIRPPGWSRNTLLVAYSQVRSNRTQRALSQRQLLELCSRQCMSPLGDLCQISNLNL